MNKQKLALLILVVVLILSLIYSYVRTPRQQHVAKLTYSSSVTGPSSSGTAQKTDKRFRQQTAQTEGQLQIALLDQPYSQFKGFRRNLFKPIFREELKVMPLPPPPPAPPPKALPPAAQAPQALPSPLETAKQEVGRLRFLGFLHNDARKTIFLAEGSEIFLVRKGDKIAGRYEVTSLTDDTITISVLASKSNLVFPLVESRSLSTGRR